ncbi:MAG: hypothetical protein ACRCSL_11370 [Microbacterium sp.]
MPGDGYNTANLARDVSLLPTPTVNDMGAGKTVEQWDEWTDRMRARHGNGNGHGPSLEIEALRLLPTPTVGESKAAGSLPGSEYRGRTLTDVWERDGEPTDQPSADGKPPSDDQLPGQLSLDATADPD